MSIGMRCNWVGLIVSTAITAAGCGSSKDSTALGPKASQFAGSYAGVIRAVSGRPSTAAPGVFRLQIDSAGRAHITVYDVTTQATVQLDGSVDAAGSISISGGGGAAAMAGKLLNGRGEGETLAPPGSWYAERDDGSNRSFFTTARYALYRIVATDDVLFDLNYGSVNLMSNAPPYQERFVPEADVGRILTQLTGGRFQASVLADVAFVLYGKGKGDHDKVLWVTTTASVGMLLVHVAVAADSKYVIPPEAKGLSSKAYELFPGPSNLVTCGFGASSTHYCQ